MSEIILFFIINMKGKKKEEKIVYFGWGIGVRLHKFTKCKTKIEEENVKL